MGGGSPLHCSTGVTGLTLPTFPIFPMARTLKCALCSSGKACMCLYETCVVPLHGKYQLGSRFQQFLILRVHCLNSLPHHWKWHFICSHRVWGPSLVHTPTRWEFSKLKNLPSKPLEQSWKSDECNPHEQRFLFQTAFNCHSCLQHKALLHIPYVCCCDRFVLQILGFLC